MNEPLLQWGPHTHKMLCLYLHSSLGHEPDTYMVIMHRYLFIYEIAVFRYAMMSRLQE